LFLRDKFIFFIILIVIVNTYIYILSFFLMLINIYDNNNYNNNNYINNNIGSININLIGIKRDKNISSVIHFNYKYFLYLDNFCKWIMWGIRLDK